MLKLIQPTSKKNQVVLAIKDAIISGSIEPGEQIVESRLAQQLGSGIPLVREALIELEYQGFVQKTPYKGTIVTKLEPTEIQQNFQLRVELEALAAAWAKANAKPADIKELQQITKRMMQAAGDLESDLFYQADLEFHRKLWSLSGNPYLAQVLERMVAQLFAFFVMKTAHDREQYVASAALHGQIVEALASKSAEELSDLMRSSLTGWKDDMLRVLFG